MQTLDCDLIFYSLSLSLSYFVVQLYNWKLFELFHIYQRIMRWLFFRWMHLPVMCLLNYKFHTDFKFKTIRMRRKTTLKSDYMGRSVCCCGWCWFFFLSFSLSSLQPIDSIWKIILLVYWRVKWMRTHFIFIMLIKCEFLLKWSWFFVLVE